jgi:hypothetical protein
VCQSLVALFFPLWYGARKGFGYSPAVGGVVSAPILVAFLLAVQTDMHIASLVSFKTLTHTSLLPCLFP